MYVDVALEGGTFIYRVPKRIEAKVSLGFLVKVPIRTRVDNGWVVEINLKPQPSTLKNIKDVLGLSYPEPLIPRELIELGKRMAEYYRASLGSLLNLMVPGVQNIRIPDYQTIRIPAYQTIRLSDYQTIRKQKRVVPSSIREALKKNEFKSILVYGLQRQRIYLESIEEALSQGKGTILLVPEIELTTPLFSLLHQRFSIHRGRESLVALFHSGIKKEERWLEWWRIKTGLAPIVVGTMSAVFAPIQKLGLIIVDEEQDPSYKSEKYPRYFAPLVAEMRAKISSALYIGGSATPSIESFYRTTDKIKLTHPKKQSKVMLVDMRKEIDPIFSDVLQAKLATYIKRQEKILLFLNRKGFASFILCADCGWVPRCKRCDIPMTYHIGETKASRYWVHGSRGTTTPTLRCHYCGYIEQAPGWCPQCRGVNFVRKGVGTVGVERYFTRLFPGIKLLRVDLSDVSTHTRLAGIFKAFERGEFQVLLGTQLVVKPPFLPEVGLVGVLSADTGLNLPDFRGPERAFSLFMRLVECSDEIVLQTYNPGHRVFKYLRAHDYRGFYEEEILLRKEEGYPPHSHLVRLLIEAKKEETAQAKASKVKQVLEKNGVDFLGPSACGLRRKGTRQKIRLHFLVKVKTSQELPLLPKDIIIDVDPIEFI